MVAAPAISADSALESRSPRLCFAWHPDSTRFATRTGLPSALGLPPSSSEAPTIRRQAFELTANKGFLVVGEATARLFDCDPQGSAMIDLRQVTRWTTPAEAARVLNERFDALVLGMAYELRPGIDYTEVLRVLEAIRIPIIVLGLSVADIALRPTDMHESAMSLARLLNERATLFGVRAISTQGWLDDHGMRHAVPLGCPSVHLFPNSLLNIQPPVGTARDMRLVTGGYLLRDRERRAMLAQFFENTRTTYILQDEVFELPDDELAAIPFSVALGRYDTAALADAVRSRTGVAAGFDRYFMFDEMSAWRQCLSWHDVYIGDRFHGGIAAIQAGIPTVIFCKDVRSRELADFYDLPALSLETALDMGPDAVITEFLAPEVLDQMKRTFRIRSATLAEHLARAGLRLNES